MPNLSISSPLRKENMTVIAILHVLLHVMQSSEISDIVLHFWSSSWNATGKLLIFNQYQVKVRF